MAYLLFSALLSMDGAGVRYIPFSSFPLSSPPPPFLTSSIVFAASAVLSALLSVYIGYLISKQLHPLEVAAWSNVYFLFIVLLVSPLYAFAGLQKEVHSFSELFWYEARFLW